MRTLDLFDLSGKTAIVTGGATGLGRQMAEALAELGANIVVCARNADRCETAAAELSRLGVGAIGVGCDVREKLQVDAVVERTVAEFGRVDILVNNAGTVKWARHGINVNAIAPGWFPSDMSHELLEARPAKRCVRASRSVASAVSTI